MQDIQFMPQKDILEPTKPEEGLAAQALASDDLPTHAASADLGAW